MNILKKIKHAKGAFSTYNIGLLQNKAFRVLKTTTTQLLQRYNISSVEWVLLGLVYEDTTAIKLSDMAEMLDVEAPFVTATVDGLERKGLLTRTQSNDDKRAKKIVLSEKAVKLIPEIEKYLTQQTRYLRTGLSLRDILTYRHVLQAIVKNAKK